MTAFSPADVAEKLGSGLLSFPVTHFTPDLEFDESAYRTNIAWLAQHDAAGLFAAGGTGEFFSLRIDEVEQVVAAAVKETADDMPVIAPAGYGTAIAVDERRLSEWLRLASSLEGIPVCPEAAACVGALETLTKSGWIKPHEQVVVFNTGAAQKYVEALRCDLPRIDLKQPLDYDRIAAG